MILLMYMTFPGQPDGLFLYKCASLNQNKLKIGPNLMQMSEMPCDRDREDDTRSRQTDRMSDRKRV